LPNLFHIIWGLVHQTTEIYARADSKQKREAIEKASENLTPSDVIGEWVDNNDLISWLKRLGKK
jgi:integrase/recombinase XerD